MDAHAVLDFRRLHMQSRRKCSPPAHFVYQIINTSVQTASSAYMIISYQFPRLNQLQKTGT